MKKILFTMLIFLASLQAFALNYGSVGVLGYGLGYQNDPYSLAATQQLVGEVHLGAMNMAGGYIKLALKAEYPTTYVQIDWTRPLNKDVDFTFNYYSNSGGFRLLVGKELIY